jgi:hypothetical protein
VVTLRQQRKPGGGVGGSGELAMLVDKHRSGGTSPTGGVTVQESHTLGRFRARQVSPRVDCEQGFSRDASIAKSAVAGAFFALCEDWRAVRS